MGKIFYIMGKSATGKDTIYQELLKRIPELKTVVLYTTRPIRMGEENGREYHFATQEEKKNLEEAGKIIECRTYQTMMGPWSYFTVDDGQINLQKLDYLMIGTLVSYEKMCAYFGKESLIPLYISVDDRERLLRAIERERLQKNPRYDDVCRRYLADEEDFSQTNLDRCNITKIYCNTELEACIREISEDITAQLYH